MNRIFFTAFLMLFVISLKAQSTHFPFELKHEMTAEEAQFAHLIGKSFNPTPPPPGIVYNIPEFGNNNGVIIRYPFGIPISLIKSLSEDVTVLTLVGSSAQQTSVTNEYQSAGVNLSNCKFLITPTDSYWTRDYSPWYISYGNNKVGAIDFPYDRPRPNDDDAAKAIAQFQNIEWFGMNVVQTGGNYMCDGYSGAASTDLVISENGSQTVAEINEKMKNYLGIDKYLTMPDPLNSYIDHIDCWSKFLSPSKILIIQVPQGHQNYYALEQAVKFFEQNTNSIGQKFEIFRISTSNNEAYCNSLILKDKVYVPLQGTSNDALAIQKYKEAMPGYTIIGFIGNPSTPWLDSDALHCRTHEIADFGQLSISHIPYFDTIAQKSPFKINATIKAFSGQGLYQDSLFVFYKVNNGDFIKLKLNNVSGDEYTCTIPPQMEGSVIKYYLKASDKSGRTSKLPYIGEHDPFKFVIKENSYATMIVSPDNLDFDTYEDAVEGKEIYIANYSKHQLIVDEIQKKGVVLPWYVDTTNLIVPAHVESGDTLILNVKIALSNILPSVLCDSIKIKSSFTVRYTKICADKLLFSSNKNKDIAQMEVFPNPISQNDDLNITVSLKKRSSVGMSLYNLNGKEIKLFENSMLDSGSHAITISNLVNEKQLKPGMYLLNMTLDNQKMVSTKILITK